MCLDCLNCHWHWCVSVYRKNDVQMHLDMQTSNNFRLIYEKFFKGYSAEKHIIGHYPWARNEQIRKVHAKVQI